ncbi:MAG: M23 family metallopeptidase [Cyanobacteria bacterium SBLK]|nr:M23 family metallopeptidase [Cyanobacteria bacterium SBLK]
MLFDEDLAVKIHALLHALLQAKIDESEHGNRIFLLSTIFLCVFYINIVYPLIQTSEQIAKEQIEQVTETISPDLTREPRRGERIAGFVVTSVWGDPRGDRKHKGVDFAMPIGTPLKTPVATKVKCFGYSYLGRRELGAEFKIPNKRTVQLLHLTRCSSGKKKAGAIVALSGTAGTGPHAHIEYDPPDRPVRWDDAFGVLAGRLPKPFVQKGNNAEN